MKLLALATYPETAAATRFRLLQTLPYLCERGWETEFRPFLDDGFFASFYLQGNGLTKARYLAQRSLARLALALGATDADAVFVQREAALIGPPYTELILQSWKSLPLIFDFDDAIWALDLSQSSHRAAARVLKNPDKCWQTMRRAAGVVAGSNYLAERAREVNPNVVVVPTVVSRETWTPLPSRPLGEVPRSRTLRIGWVGTHTTAHQLTLVEPALRQLRAEGHEFEVRVVGASPEFRLQTVEVRREPWRLETEINEFQEIDIGLAPMHGGPVYEGKCGFKQLQYMAVGVPFVSSLVGGARDFVADGEVGLVANTTGDWYAQVNKLLQSPRLRAKLSQNGREMIEKRYCLEVQGPRLAGFIEESIERERRNGRR